MLESTFNFITGIGLGFSYSSFNQISDNTSHKSIGQAGIQSYINVLNGNLVINDHLLKINETNNLLNLGYIYNSQAASTPECWQFAIKRLTQIPNGKIAVMREEDGHLTTYQLGVNDKYIAPGLNDGTPSLTPDPENQAWKWYHPKTQITEVYDQNGLLIKQLDVLGRTTTYTYDANGNIATITGPSGSVYKISHAGNTVGIYEVSNANERLLQHYSLDAKGRIETTQTPDGYKIQYQYNLDNSIKSIIQDDGTNVSYTYNSDGGKPCVSTMQVGDKTPYTFTYPTASNPDVAVMTDGCPSQTIIMLDPATGMTRQISKQTGFDQEGTEIDTTVYQYNQQHQLQVVITPSGGKTEYEYNGPSGLLSKKTGADGQVTQFDYDNVYSCLVKKTNVLNGEDLATHYIYDTHNGRPFLRFEISPAGRVKEYTPDANLNIAEVRDYLAETFNTIISSKMTDALDQLESWADKQDPQQVSLSKFTYNTRGQVETVKHYADIAENGQGIEDAAMAYEEYSWDEFGNQLTKEVQYNAIETACTDQHFDNLQRLTHHVNALNQKTSYTYLTERDTTKIQVLQQNNRLETKTLNNAGLPVSDTAQIDGKNNPARLTRYAQDNAGRIVKTTLPDGNVVYTFYDRQNRIGFNVTASGVVTQYEYDAINRFNTTTVYDSPIDFKQLIINDELPTASRLISLLAPNPKKDRSTYDFFDASSRLAYQVNARNVITQCRYDALDRETAKITYADTLTDLKLQQLKSKQLLNPALQYQPDKDRAVLTFYDKDGKKIAKQDGAGFITQYIRDAAGRTIQKKRFANSIKPNPAITDFSQIAPTLDKDNDATTYYFRDVRGQITAEVDAGGYLTTHTYLPCGLRERSLRYATKIAKEWFDYPNVMPAFPVTSSEDQCTHFKYDLLGRLIEINGPLGKTSLTEFDVMGNMTRQEILDSYDPENIDGDHLRGTQVLYDEWDQATHGANPYIHQLIAALKDDPEKQKKIAELWQNKSTRNHYDATGLKISATDPLNNKTCFYYDKERRPVVSIDPTGAVIETVNNSFGEPVELIAYATRLSATELKELSGGFISDAFRKQMDELRKKGAHVTKWERNKCGQIVKKTDANENVTLMEYNAFGEVENEYLPVTDKIPSLVIKHEYEARGLEIKTTKIADNKKIMTETKYRNLYGKPTEYIDENKGLHQNIYNSLGQVKERIDPAGQLSRFEHDAFDRVLVEMDTEQHKTVHTYNQQERSHTVQYPEKGNLTRKDNVFANKVMECDGEGNKQEWQHAPDGQQAQHKDQLGNTTDDAFDLKGRHVVHTDAAGVLATKNYNGADQLTKCIEDVKGLALKTEQFPDAFGNPELVIHPNKVTTSNMFDGNNNLTKSIVDPSTETHVGLDLITKQKYNGQNALVEKTQGDKSNPDLYREKYLRDGFNRETGKVVDPDNLAINEEQTLDATGNVIVETDANGNKKWLLYDKNNNQRFVIDAEGGVYERFYDSENRLRYERKYHNGIDVNKSNFSSWTISSLIRDLVYTDPQDSLTYYYYDKNGNECFTVNSVGIVKEKRYNKDDKVILDIDYEKQLTTLDFGTLNFYQLNQFAKEQESAPKNRLIYHIRDKKQQECFTIDANGYLSQSVFDARGNTIIKIQYDLCLKKNYDLAAIAAMSVEDIQQKIIPVIRNDEKDHYAYQLFDNLNRPLFTVGPEGQVTGYQHDAEHNLTQTCQFDQRVKVPSDYEVLAEKLKTFSPKEGLDRIVKSEFDAGNRKKCDVVPMGGSINYIDQYFRDARGNIKSHTDAEFFEWKSDYDTAGRSNKDTAPPVIVTTVKQNLDNKLEAKFDTVSLEKQKVLSKTGKELEIIEAANTEDARRIKFEYNKRDDLVGTIIENVKVDDPAKPGSLTDLPTKTVNISTKIVYDSKGNKVAEKDENDNWTYHIYDSENREIYTVDSLGGTIQTDRDAFGDVIRETKYNALLNLDLTQYRMTGIPLSVMQNPGVIKPGWGDRTCAYERDNRGNVIKMTLPRTFYSYLSNANGKPVFGFANPQTAYDYDAFGNQVTMSQLYDPDSNLWALHLKWYDRNDKIIAESDAIHRVKIYEYNTFREESKRWEWAEKPKTTPTPKTSFKQLLASYQAHATQKDRMYLKWYDLRGLLEIEKRGFRVDDKTVMEIIQEVQLTPDGPVMQDKTIPGKSVAYAYDAVKNNIAKIFEDGTKEHSYFNALRLLIGTAGVPRESVDDNGKPITLVPLEWVSHNACGQENYRARFKLGAVNPVDNKTLPQPIDYHEDDQREMILHDNRGVTAFRQDANGNVTAYTFNPISKQLARQFYTRSTWQVNNGEAVSIPHLDEKRYAFDQRGEVIYASLLRDNKIEQTSTSSHNTFHELTTEGPTFEDQEVFHYNDDLGRNWKTNYDKNIYTITLHNLIGYEVGQIKSTTFDLANFPYEDLPKLLTTFRNQIEITNQIKDNAGRVITTIDPGLFPLVQRKEHLLPPSNIPLTFRVGNNAAQFGKVSITWDQPNMGDMLQTFKIYPVANPDKVKILPIQTINGCSGVDISAFPVDVYAVVINYANPPDQDNFHHDNNLVYVSAALLQIDGENTLESESVIALVQEDAKIILKGNLNNLDSVLLYTPSNDAIEIPVMHGDNNQYYIDLSNYPSGSYSLSPVNGKSHITPAFSIGVTQGITCDQLYQTTTKGISVAALTNPLSTYELDNWDNITKKTNAFGKVTDLTYNSDNQIMVTIEPEVENVDETGKSEIVRPVTRFGHNIRGFDVGLCDANNNTQANIIDAVGQRLKLILGDGTIESEAVIDALGRITRTKDSRGKECKHDFDRNNNILKTTSAMGLIYAYTYDEKDKRSSSSLPSSQYRSNYYYNFGVTGDICETYLPLGQNYQFKSDANHLPILFVDPDKNTLIYDRDYFGNINWWENYSKTKTFMKRDKKSQLTHEYTIDQKNTYSLQTSAIYYNTQPNIELYDFLISAYDMKYNPDLNRNIVYSYNGNTLSGLTDLSQFTHSNYIDDPLYRRVQSEFNDGPTQSRVGSNMSFDYFKLKYDDVKYQTKICSNITADYLNYSVSLYDSADKETYININDQSEMAFKYDTVGNIRLFDIKTNSDHKTYWNKYNKSDFLTLYQGSNDNGEIKLISGQGTTFDYSQGMRKSQSSLDSSGKLLREDLDYNDDGWLTSLTDTDGKKVIRTYDDAGWVSNATQTKPGQTTYQQNILVNANGWLEKMEHKWSDTHHINTEYSDFMGQGLPRKEVTNYYDPNEDLNYRDTFDISYRGFDHFVPERIEGYRDTRYGDGVHVPLITLYDCNSNLAGSVKSYFDGSELDDDGLYAPWGNAAFSQFNYFRRNHYGALLEANQIYLIDDLRDAVSDSVKLNEYFSHKQPPLMVDNREKFNYNVNDSLLSSAFVHHEYKFDVKPYQPAKEEINIANPVRNAYVNFVPESNPDAKKPISNLFRINTETFPLLVPDRILLSFEDTLASLARNKFGYQGYAKEIARFNNLDVRANLDPGTVINMPQIIPKYYNFETKTPYDRFINAIMEQLTPQLIGKLPPPVSTIIFPMIYVQQRSTKKKKHGGLFGGGFLGMIVDFIIIAAATIIGGNLGMALATYILQANAVAAAVAAAAISASAIATAVEVITTAVVAGITSAVGQEAAVAMGFKEHFSLNQAASVGLTAGIGAGFGSPALSGFGKGLAGDTQVIGKALYQSGRSAVLQQLAQMETGKTPFNMRRIAESMLTSLAGAAMSPYMPQNAAAQSLIGGALNAGAGLAIDPKSFNFEETAASMLGSALGTQLGKAATTSLRTYVAQQASNYEKSLATQQAKEQEKSLSWQNNPLRKFGLFNDKAQSSPASNEYGRGNNTSTAKSANDHFVGKHTDNHVSSSTNTNTDWYRKGLRDGAIGAADLYGDAAEKLEPKYASVAKSSYAGLYQNSKKLLQLETLRSFNPDSDRVTLWSNKRAEILNDNIRLSKQASSANAKLVGLKAASKAGTFISALVDGYEFIKNPTPKNGVVLGSEFLAGMTGTALGGPIAGIIVSSAAGYGAGQMYDWAAQNPSVRVPMIITGATAMVNPGAFVLTIDITKDYTNSLRPNR